MPSSAFAAFSDQIYGQGGDDVQTVNTQQMDQDLQNMQQDGQEEGGPLQEYMDQTNDTLLRDQPDQVEIINNQNAIRNLDEQRVIENSQEGFSQHPAASNPNVTNAIKNAPSGVRGSGGGRGR